MTSFEGMKPRAGAWVRMWRWPRLAPLYAVGIAVGAALGIGLGLGVGGEQAAEPMAPEAAPVVAPAQVIEPPPIEARLHLVELPVTFSSALPPALADEMPLPAAVPEAPVVLETAPAAPVAPVASQPVVAPKPAPPPPPPPPVAKPDFYVPNVSTGGITNLEQRLLDGINAERANAGLAPYAFDAGLSQ